MGNSLSNQVTDATSSINTNRRGLRSPPVGTYSNNNFINTVILCIDAYSFCCFFWVYNTFFKQKWCLMTAVLTSNAQTLYSWTSVDHLHSYHSQKIAICSSCDMLARFLDVSYGSLLFYELCDLLRSPAVFRHIPIIDIWWVYVWKLQETAECGWCRWCWHGNDNARPSKAAATLSLPPTSAVASCRMAQPFFTRVNAESPMDTPAVSRFLR